MPKHLEYIVTKLEKKDKAWPEFLDKSIEHALKNKESGKELIDFYTTVKIAIWQHLNSNLEQIIKDTHKARSQIKSSLNARKAINAPSSALTVAIPLNIDVEPSVDVVGPSLSRHLIGSENDSPLLEHTSLLSDIIEQMFDFRQPQNFKAMLTDFDATRIIAALVSGHLVNAIQINSTPLGIKECEKVYSRAVVRVIVEKQLGSKSRSTDYNALIKSLSIAKANKDKVLPLLLEILIKSAQMGNPYTRAIDKQNVLIRTTIIPSKAFAKYEITSAVFKPRADFLQFVNTKRPTLLFSGASCIFRNQRQVNMQYFQLGDVPAFLPAELFFTKAAADYGDAESQFNYGVDLLVNGKTAVELSLADKYWRLAAQQGIVAAKHNHDLYLYNSNNLRHDKEIISNINTSKEVAESFKYKTQDATLNMGVTALSPPLLDKNLKKLNITNKKIVEVHDLTTKSARLKVVSQKTTPLSSNGSRTGAYPIGAKMVKRKTRSYKEDRDVQLLRHIATQLYGFCRTNKVDAIEVQAMYYDNSLYISTNMLNAAKLIASELKNKQAMKDVLISPYSCGNSSKIKISRRHAHKIRARVYKEFDCSNERANKIKALLNNNLIKISSLDISNLNTNGHSFKHESNTIYVVTKRSQGLVRHAEEDLMDILEAIYKFYGGLSGEALIYGKRRPCFSCYSRLDSLQDENGPYVKFNPKPGLFFETAFYSQSTAAATETHARLATVPTIYESADDAGYNTLSDSDGEEYKGLRMWS